MREIRVELPLDQRSASFVTTDRRVLKAAAAAMPTSSSCPSNVATLLERARRQFMLGSVDYDNFADCVATGFKAIETLLRHRLGADAPERGALGKLIDKCTSLRLVTEYEHEYLATFVLHFRNKLAHPETVVAFTPGMSDECLARCHRFIAEFCDRHDGVEDIEDDDASS